MGSLFNQTSDTASSTNSQQSQGQGNTTTPNLPPWLQTAFQNNVTQGQKLASGAAAPVFGQPQQAAYQAAQNDQAANATTNLNSQLAAHGVSNPAAASQGAENIRLANTGNQSAFLSSVPQLNSQASQTNQEAAMSGGLAAAKATPYGNTTTGTSSGQTSGTGQQDITSNAGIGGLLSSILGAGLGGATGGNLSGSANSLFTGLSGNGWAAPVAPSNAGNVDPSALMGETPSINTSALNVPQAAPAVPFGENNAGSGGNMDDMFSQLFPSFSGGGFGSPFN